MKRIIALLACLGVTMFGIVALSGPADAHTPKVTATCDNVNVTLQNYQVRAGKTNTVQIWIDNTKVVQADFGSSYTRDFPLSPSWESHTWHVIVHAWDSDRYNVNQQGQTTPCERPKPDKPTPLTETRDHLTTADCKTAQVDHVYEARSQTVTWNPETWTWDVTWGEWHVTKTEHVDNSAFPCPVVIPPHHTPVPPVVYRHAHIGLKITDRCNCYFDRVKVKAYDHSALTVSKTKRGNRTWIITVTGKHVGNVQYLVPSTVNGHSGYAVSHVYKVRTKNQTCPCVKAGNCQVKYPNFHPQHYCAPARSKCG